MFEYFDDMASYANLNEQDRLAYDANVKAYRDMIGQLEYAEARGEARGEAQGIRLMVKGMAEEGISLDKISKIAKMSIDKIKEILK